MAQQIAAVIVIWNRLDELKGGITALRQQTRPPDQIIVINNGSTDCTREWLQAQTDLHVIHQDNRGAGGGFATGLVL